MTRGRWLRRWAVIPALLLSVLVPAAGRAHYSPNHVVVATGFFIVDGLPYSPFNMVATKTASGYQGLVVAGATTLKVTCLKIVNAGVGGHLIYARAQSASGTVYVELLDYNLDNIYVTVSRGAGPCGTGDFDRPQITGLVLTLG